MGLLLGLYLLKVITNTVTAVSPHSITQLASLPEENRPCPQIYLTAGGHGHLSASVLELSQPHGRNQTACSLSSWPLSAVCL